MGKRAILAFMLSLLVIISYNYYIAQKYPLKAPAESSPPSSEIAPAPVIPSGPRAPKEALTSFPVQAAKEIVVETDLVRLTLTSSGARIKSYRLKKYPAEKTDPQLVTRQIKQIERALISAPLAEQELLQREKSKLNFLLAASQTPQPVELVSPAASLDQDFSPTLILAEQAQLSERLNTGIYQCNCETLRLNSQMPQGQLEFTVQDAQGRVLKKVYSFSNSSYIIGLDITFTGWPEESFTPGHFLVYYGPDLALPPVLTGRRTNLYQGPISCFQTGQQRWVLLEKYTNTEKNLFIRREHQGQGVILWTGLENKYFLAGLSPLFLSAASQQAAAVVVEKNRFGEQKVALKIPYAGRGPYRFQLYLGPKQTTELKKANLTLEKSIDYGLFSPIARVIYSALMFFNRWTHNFGWAIVLLSIVVKIIFHPLAHHSLVAMQKMQQEMKTLQPEINALREKSRDNPQRLNKEIMELYRKRGINPLTSCQSGCLPLLLQIPVFFALYAVLFNAIELRGAAFFGWLSDLSAKDPYYILPILMGLSMVVQNKLSGMEATASTQQEQARMMAVLMPVMLTWVFASLPSGIVLYWLTFNLLTAGHQLLIKRKQAALAST